jgi:hypothetical protein
MVFAERFEQNLISLEHCSDQRTAVVEKLGLLLDISTRSRGDIG